ncbi:MAG: ABC transporter ATP-binding protein [Candidatus Peribacteria bacterium]|nr:MAG: ABC transporter ATP-binding protein [Candidatus Peribacteria bacterium]
MSGYIRADKGDILIDGQALKKTSLKSYYQHIGYLTQEPSVFDGTVLENLTYAIDTPPSPQPSPLRGEGAISSPSPTKEKGVGDEGLHQILKLAKCEFIYDLPNGLETEI